LRAIGASSPLAFTGCPIGFARRLSPVGVCDALPQRNCGRFARPSLYPWNLMKEPQANHQFTRQRPCASPIP